MLTTNKSANIFQPEYQEEFGRFAMGKIKSLRNSEEIDLEDTLRTIKLIMKYYANISFKDRFELSEVLMQDVFPIFEHKELKFYSLLLVLRFEGAVRNWRK